MENLKIANKDQMIMSLVHFFVTKENYTPIIVNGTKDEVWLENLENPIKVIRINNNYIHNDEQYKFDVNKLYFVLKQIRKKTLTLKVNALNICLDVSDRVNVTPIKNVNSVSFKGFDDIQKNELINDLFPNISEDLITKNDSLDMIKCVTDDINNATNEKNEFFKKMFSSKKIIVTYALISLCILVYCLSIFYPQIFYGGMVNGLYVKSGDYYRLISAVFLHGSVFHLFVNMYSLKILGTQLETYIGKLKFLGIFLISGIFGSLFSVLINGDNSFSVGASGAIFGLAASLVYFGYYYRAYLNAVLINQLVPVILINLLIGFTFTGIDNAAHIGGLVGGYLSSAAFGIKADNNFSEKTNSLLALIVLTAFLFYLLFK